MNTMTTTIDGRTRGLERHWRATGDEDAARGLLAALGRQGLQTPYQMDKAGFEGGWPLIQQVRAAEEAELRASPIGHFARRSSSVGPCFISSGVRSSGRIVRETAKFYVTIGSAPNDREKRVRKDKVHLRPCSCCTDHANTVYPRGYDN